jgi:hypothetical protein
MRGRAAIQQEISMKTYRLLSVVVLATIVSIVPIGAEPSTADQVKNWTLRQWSRAVAEFRKDKDKWASCRKQSRDMKLRGKASWSFLYGCMKG